MDDEWGFQVCYDKAGCLLGANPNEMVSAHSA
jgi:hypothetical protein